MLPETLMVATSKVPTYPKIETLYERNERTHKIIEGRFRCPEFEIVDRWAVHEKIDGTNIRVALLPDGNLFIGGRTDDAQIPPFLLQRVNEMFTADSVRAAFDVAADNPGAESIVLYGEGYGARIQKGGGNYREGVSFRLFDVKIGRWWLAHENVEDVARKLGVKTAPFFGVFSTEEAIDLVLNQSAVALDDGGKGCEQEGIVARAEPLLLMRNGDRVMWKLKVKDYPAKGGPQS